MSSKCAKPSEELSVRVAAVQQRLMVAALTCNDVADFNRFQRGYLQRLRQSDQRLQIFFRRLYGARGESLYYSFETRLANDDSMLSIHNNPAYCKAASQAFAVMEAQDRPSLSEFVEALPIKDPGPVPSCSSLRTAREPIPSIVPTPNPLRMAIVERGQGDTAAQARQ
jgi:hypothetical protein